MLRLPIETSHTYSGRCVFGRTGSGKSALLRAWRDSYGVRTADGFAPGYVVLVDPKDEHVKPLHGIRFRPHEGADFGVDAPLAEFVDAGVMRAFQRGNCLVIVDELDLAVGRGQTGPIAPLRVVMHGRHRNVSYVWAARRPAEIPRGYTSQATELAFFQLSEPRDVDYAVARGCPRDWLGALRVGQWIHLVGGMTPHIHNTPSQVCEVGT